MDSGFDAARLMSRAESRNQGGMGSNASAGAVQVDFLIKWNPRSTDVAALAARLSDDPTICREQPRADKRITTWEQALTVDGIQQHVRRVMRLIERTIDKRGQMLLVPELTLDGWMSSLPANLAAQGVIGPYAHHGTHEQLHSEFKTNLNLTRLLLGKFDTNYLVC